MILVANLVFLILVSNNELYFKNLRYKNQGMIIILMHLHPFITLKTNHATLAPESYTVIVFPKISLIPTASMITSAFSPLKILDIIYNNFF